MKKMMALIASLLSLYILYENRNKIFLALVNKRSVLKIVVQLAMQIPAIRHRVLTAVRSLTTF